MPRSIPRRVAVRWTRQFCEVWRVSFLPRSVPSMQRSSTPFVHNPAFEAAGAAERFLRPITVPASGVLSHETERALFFRMNYAKWRASNDPSVAAEMLTQAQADRSTLAERNLALAKRIASDMTRKCPRLFEDAFAEASLRLVQAIDAYDAGRGLKFVTFAFAGIRWSIMGACRVDRQQRDKATGRRHKNGDPDVMKTLEDRTPFDAVVGRMSAATEVAELLEAVQAADRPVVASMFGVDGEPIPQSLEDVVQKFGVSRQRLFQRRNRAFDRMREAAELRKARTA